VDFRTVLVAFIVAGIAVWPLLHLFVRGIGAERA
jgi:hypothetical protein